MKCLREMNDRKESLKIKNLNAYFHVVVTYNTSLLGENE